METVKRILMYFRCPHWPFKFFKDLLSPVIKIGAIAAAPFTGGSSLAAIPLLTGIEQGDAAKKAKAEADRVQAEQERKAQQQAEVWAQQIAGGSPAGIPIMGPAGTAPPVIVQVPTPVPVPGQQGMTPLLLVGGAALVVFVILRR